MIALVLDHLWQSTLFAAVVGLLTLTLRNNGAKGRFWLWFAASVKFLIPFAALIAFGRYFLTRLTFPLLEPSLPHMRSAAQSFSYSMPMPSDPLNWGLSATIVQGFLAPATRELPAHIENNPYWTPLLLALWTIGFATIVSRWLVRWRSLRGALHGAIDLQPSLAPIATKLASSSLEPGLVGIWRPVILLPQGITDRLSGPEMKAIIAHELCHLRRRDNLMAATHMLVEALVWFHPPIWWIGARLNEERELACDEYVLAAGNEPQVYAEGILKVCKLYFNSPLACASGVSGANLRNRVQKIMKNHQAIRLNALKKALLASMVMVAIAAPLLLSLLTTPTAMAFAPAQTTNDKPYPGTEAALRRLIESAEKGKVDSSGMTLSLASAIKTSPIKANIQKWGALKSITYWEKVGGYDVYLVDFENQLTDWRIGPLFADGKFADLGFGIAAKRSDKGPSPGAEAALRLIIEGELSGQPYYSIMSPAMVASTKANLSILRKRGESFGTLKSITFKNINFQGWDVYNAVYEHGTATWSVYPLTNGKLSGLMITDMLLPQASQHPGTEAAVRRYIESLEERQPNYNDMVPEFADNVRRLLPGTQALIKSWGALKSIEFEGGGMRNSDLFVVTFEHAKAQWGITPLNPDGKMVNSGFHRIS